MNSRERVIRAVEFGTPDRPPVMHWTLPGAYRVYGKRLVELYERYPSDVLLSPASHSIFALPGTRSRVSATETVDEWGVVFRELTEDYNPLPVSSPLADYDALDGYSFPDPLSGRQRAATALMEAVRRDRHEHYVIARVGNLWQQLNKIRGYEGCMLDLLDGRQEFFRLLNQMEDYLLARIGFWNQFEEVDGLHIGDDWGTQTQLMIRPNLWREVFKPIYRRLVAAIHRGGKHAHLHSDGHTHEIVADLVEVGFDSLNLQLWCMDTEELARAFAGKVCFRGEIDRQFVLPKASPEDVSTLVRRARELFHTPTGGYICYGQVAPDVPWANAEAMLRTFYEGSGTPDLAKPDR